MAARNPPTEFDASFRKHVIPRAQKKIELFSLFIALGESDFSSSYAGIMLGAGRLGLWHTSDRIRTEFEDWASVQLIHKAEEKMKQIEDYEKMSSRVLADIDRHMEAFIAHKPHD